MLIMLIMISTKYCPWITLNTFIIGVGSTKLLDLGNFQQSFPQKLIRGFDSDHERRHWAILWIFLYIGCMLLVSRPVWINVLGKPYYCPAPR